MAGKQAGQMSGQSGEWAGKGTSPGTLEDALTRWADPADPCAASRRVMQSFTTYQVFPAWTPAAGKVLLCQVEQAVESKSPGITSLLELLRECARSHHLQEEEEEEEEGNQQQHPHYHPHPHRAAPVVKAYTLLCAFPTRVLMEDGAGDGGGEGGGGRGEGFDICAFAKGITYLFNTLLEHCRKAVLAQARLVGACQLQVVVDEGGSVSNGDDRKQKQWYTMDHRRTILKDRNELLISLSVGVRADIKRQCYSLFTQLPGLLKEVGDYDTQASIVELIYRLTTLAERSCNVAQWFPELECTIQCLFLTISEFEPHCRRFLNAYNASLGDSCKVFTIPCHVVYIGKLKLCKPENTSYPRFWIDFNLDTYSILIICQVEGKPQSNDRWECLSIEHEEVERVNLTQRMHSYTLEVEYSNLTTVEELFSSPLDSDSRTLLSTLVFFEFSPQPLLEKLCTLIYGNKLTVNKLEPKGWRGTSDSSRTISTSSSSFALGRKYSSAVTDVDADPSDPSILLQGNGPPDHLITSQSTQSTMTSLKKYRKCSSVSMVCSVDDVEVTEHCGRKSSKSRKPSLSTKRSKASVVFMKFNPSDLTKVNKRDATGEAHTSEKHDTLPSNKSKSTEKLRSRRNYRKKGMISSTKCITITSPQPPQSSFGCYLPVSFTLLQPGAAVSKSRVVSQSPASTKTTNLGRKDKDQQLEVPKAQVIHTAAATATANSINSKEEDKHTEMKDLSSDTTEIFMQTEVTTLSTKVAAADPKEEKVQCEEKPGSCSSPKAGKTSQPVHPASKESEEQKEANTKLSVIFPSSEESCKIDQDTHVTKNCANSDIGSVTISSEIHSQPKVQPGKTVATTQKHSTPSLHTVSDDGAPYGSILQLVSNTQTKTVGEKESKQTKMDSPKDLKTIIEQEHVIDPVQHMPETLVSTETSSTGDKSNSTKPVQAKHTWKKPNRIKALEANPIHSKIAPILQEPQPPIQQVHDDELFSPDSSPLQQSEVTTQPFNDYVAPRASFPPRPPHRDPPETLVSHCIKGVDGSVKHTPPPDIEVATRTRSAAFESSSGVSLFHTPPEESTVGAARNCSRYLFIQEVKDKRTMSPLINLSKDGSDACLRDIGSSELRNDAEGISRQQEEVLKPQDYVLTPHEQVFGSQREILGPQREALGPQKDNFVPQEEVLGSQEEVLGPQKGVLCPQDEIFGSEKERTVPQGEELREQEEVLKQQEKVSEPHEVSAWDTENKDENTNKAQDSSVTNILSNSTSDSPRKSNTKVIEVEELFVLNSNCEKVEKLKEAKTSPTEPSGQLYSDKEKENRKKAKGKSPIKQLYQEQHVLSPTKKTPARDNQRKRGSSYQWFTPNTSEEVHRKHKSYPVLQKPEEILSLATRPCRGKRGNKRKLFDPMAQAHMNMNPSPEEKTLCPQSNEDRQSESLQMDKKIRKLEHNTTRRISPTGQDDKTADDSGKPHSAGKQRWFSKRESSVKTSRSSKSERKSKGNLPHKRASGFLEDSFLNHEAHTIYSDFDSSPAGVVDSWFAERIENAKYSRVAYCNTSSRKCTVEKKRDQKRKKRKLRMTSDSDMSSSYLSVSSGIDRFSKAETVLKPTERKAFKSGTKVEDTTECTVECIDISDSPAKIGLKRKSTCGERPSYYAPLTRGTASEVSQTSSHDEWELTSTGKKKRPLPKKERENLTVGKSKERKSRREGGKWFKGKSSQDSSGLHVNNSSTLTEPGGVADNLKPCKSPVDTLRHTSKSSLENEFISFVLTASRVRTGGNKGSSPCLQPPSVEPHKSSVELQISSVEPQLSSPMPRTSLESLVSTDLQKSPPPLQVMSTEHQTSSLFPRMPSPMSQILTPEEDLSSQPVRESLQPFVDINISQEHSTPRHTSPVISEKTPSPALTQSFEVHPPPQQTLETTDISAILNPGVDAHAPPSGPLQSTLLDNLLEKSKVTSTGPRFSYVSEAESSFITNQEEEKKDDELTVIRNEHMPGQCESPSVVDSVITELRYDRGQAGSFTTSSTMTEVHHCSYTACGMDDEPSHLSAASGMATPVLTPHKALVNAKSPHQLNTRVTEGDVKGRKKHHTTMSSITTTTTPTTTTTATSTACIQPPSTTTSTIFSSSSSPLSLVQSVAPTAMVPPQSVAGAPSRGGSSGNADFISRVYRQFMPDLQQTPPSSRRHAQGGSPVHPQARILFEAARRENEAHIERRQLSSLNPEVLAAIMAVIADLQHFSTATHRLSRSLGTLLTKYMEHHWEEGEAV